MIGSSASKTGGIVVAEIQMTAMSFGGHFLIVEGDDDSKFWKARIDRNNCQLVIVYGKEHVLDASKLLDRSKFAKPSALWIWTTIGTIPCNIRRVLQQPIYTILK